MKHFYTVYNYENEQISLGINKASKDDVRMYAPGQGGPTDDVRVLDKAEETVAPESPAPDND